MEGSHVGCHARVGHESHSRELGLNLRIAVHLSLHVVKASLVRRLLVVQLSKRLVSQSLLLWQDSILCQLLIVARDVFFVDPAGCIAVKVEDVVPIVRHTTKLADIGQIHLRRHEQGQPTRRLDRCRPLSLLKIDRVRAVGDLAQRAQERWIIISAGDRLLDNRNDLLDLRLLGWGLGLVLIIEIDQGAVLWFGSRLFGRCWRFLMFWR